MKKLPGYMTKVPNYLSKYQIIANKINVLKIKEPVISCNIPVIKTATNKDTEPMITLPIPYPSIISIYFQFFFEIIYNILNI